VTITSRGRLDVALKRHADARKALAGWMQITIEADWQDLQDVRRAYASADGVEVASGRIVTVFNIRGNNYRLLTTIDYELGAVQVLDLLTHAEYDKEKWKKTL